MKAIVLALFGFVLAAFACIANLAGEDPASNAKRTLVATVLKEPIYLDQLTPPETSRNQRELSAAEFANWLHETRVRGLTSRITARILADYVEREKLRPTDAQIDAILADVARDHAEAVEFDAAAREKLATQSFWARGSARDWRTAKALFEKHGGRVAVSAFGGFMSVEGRQALLQESAQAGEITFQDKTLETAFWKQVRDERVLDATLSPEASRDLFDTAPWDQWRAMLARERSEKAESIVVSDRTPAPATPAVPSK